MFSSKSEIPRGCQPNNQPNFLVAKRRNESETVHPRYPRIQKSKSPGLEGCFSKPAVGLVVCCIQIDSTTLKKHNIKLKPIKMIIIVCLNSVNCWQLRIWCSWNFPHQKKNTFRKLPNGNISTHGGKWWFFPLRARGPLNNQPPYNTPYIYWVYYWVCIPFSELLWGRFSGLGAPISQGALNQP